MTTRSGGESGWSNWVIFGGIVLMVVGFLNVIQGLAALLKDEVYLISKNGLLVTADYTAWGWTILIWGAVLILAGVGLFMAQAWARWFAVVIVALNVVVQFAFFPAYPLWSLIVIGLDVIVLVALITRWEEAKTGLLG